MAKIDDTPNAVTSAGQAFDYTTPPQPRLATLVLVNAPLDPDHINVGLNTAAYDAFIDAEVIAGRAWVSAELNIQDPQHDLQLPIEFETAAQFYNYGRLTLDGRAWYLFYTPVYLNKNTTRFIATLDEWPTFTWALGYGQIDRGHVAVAASSAGDISYCLEPEPRLPGALLGHTGYQIDPLGAPAVLVISTTDLRANPFVAVDSDLVTTASDQLSYTLASGDISAPEPVLPPVDYGYSIGNTLYETDPFNYPYSASAGLGSGNTMYRPAVTGATPSMVDGIAAEGGAFVYGSVGAYLEHMAELAHVPWIADGISRAVLIPGGSGGGASPVDLTPWTHVQSIGGAPSWYASIDTTIDYDTTVTANWLAGLPAAYSVWTKLRTAPYSAIQIGDRQGNTNDYEPQNIVGLGPITAHVQGAFHPHADVVVWLTGADGTTAPNNPVTSPVAAELSHFAVGRDSVYAPGAAGVAAERSQSITDMFLATQHSLVDSAFTRSSAFTATQYAIAEAI